MEGIGCKVIYKSGFLIYNWTLDWLPHIWLKIGAASLYMTNHGSSFLIYDWTLERLPYIWLNIGVASLYMTEHWSSFPIYDWTLLWLPHIWLNIGAASSYMTEHWSSFLIYDWTFLQCAKKEVDFPHNWGCTLSLKFPNKEKFGSLTERLVFQARIQPLLQPVEDMVAVLHHRLLTANHCQCVSTNPTVFNQFQHFHPKPS